MRKILQIRQIRPQDSLWSEVHFVSVRFNRHKMMLLLQLRRGQFVANVITVVKSTGHLAHRTPFGRKFGSNFSNGKSEFVAMHEYVVVKMQSKVRAHSRAPLQPYDHHKGFGERMGYIMEEHFVTLLRH